jgi:hypothetical protein
MTDPFERAVLREELDKNAEKLDQARGGLLVHATVYVSVNVLLVIVWALTWTGFPWFVFPILGWGIGLSAHAASYRAQLSSQRRLEKKFNLS